MRNTRGFTLLELMVAGSIGSVVAIAGFVALAAVQGAAADQQRLTDLASTGRLALDLMTRDIRSAGDSFELLPQHCMAGFHAPGTTHNCAAILDPHPWRITIARNAWDPGADQVPFNSDDLAPTLAFENAPDDVVTFEFVPDGDVRDFGNGHLGYLGQLRRIVNPFGFDGGTPRVTVLADNVVVDNRMRVNPTDPTQSDPRTDFNLFMYQVLRMPTETWVGDTELVARTTRHGPHLLPPVRFFDPTNGTYASYALGTPAQPWLPNYGAESVVGLYSAATAATGALRSGSADFGTDLRYILDYNRIRTVRIAFKVVEPIEDPKYLLGIDLVPDSPGTARVVPFETTTELKVFSAEMI